VGGGNPACEPRRVSHYGLLLIQDTLGHAIARPNCWASMAIGARVGGPSWIVCRA